MSPMLCSHRVGLIRAAGAHAHRLHSLDLVADLQGRGIDTSEGIGASTKVITLGWRAQAASCNIAHVGATLVVARFARTCVLLTGLANASCWDLLRLLIVRYVHRQEGRPQGSPLSSSWPAGSRPAGAAFGSRAFS